MDLAMNMVIWEVIQDISYELPYYKFDIFFGK
jgi:hypothetical protein